MAYKGVTLSRVTVQPLAVLGDAYIYCTAHAKFLTNLLQAEMAPDVYEAVDACYRSAAKASPHLDRNNLFCTCTLCPCVMLCWVRVALLLD